MIMLSDWNVHVGMGLFIIQDEVKTLVPCDDFLIE